MLKVVTTIILLATNTQEVQAYLDPGTGTMILQAVGAAFAASLFFLKQYWYKVKSMLSKKSSDDN